MQTREKQFNAIYKQYYPTVYRLVVARGLSPMDAEEIADEAFIRLWACFVVQDGEWTDAAVISWLHKTARLISLEYKRQRDRHIASDSLDTYENVLPADPEDWDADENYLSLIRKFKTNLTEDEFRLLDLALIQGLAGDTVAQKLGISPTALRMRLSRLRKKLRNMT